MKRVYITVTGTVSVCSVNNTVQTKVKNHSLIMFILCVSQTIRKLCNISNVCKYNFKFITGLNQKVIILIIIIIIIFIFCLIKE